MCDLWRNTLEETVPEGAIAAQIRYALERLPQMSRRRPILKLYNAGSFFDPSAIPPEEYAAVARLSVAFSADNRRVPPCTCGPRCLSIP